MLYHYADYVYQRGGYGLIGAARNQQYSETIRALLDVSLKEAMKHAKPR